MTSLAHRQPPPTTEEAALAALAPYGIEALHPDVFLYARIILDPRVSVRPCES